MKWRFLFPALTLSAGAVAGFDPASVKTSAGIELIPLLEAEQVYDSNLYRQAANEQSAWISIISPGLTVQGSDSKRRYTGSLRLSQGSVLNRSMSFLDVQLSAHSQLTFDQRNRLDIGLWFDRLHDEFNARFSDGVVTGLDELDHYHDLGVSLRYGYGVLSAPLRVDGHASYVDTRYDTRRAVTRDHDHSDLSLGSTVFYRLGATTELILDLALERNRFLVDPAADSRSGTIQVGLDWQWSEITQARLKMGFERLTFKNRPGPATFDELRWDGALRWRPRSHAIIELQATRWNEQPPANDDFTRRTDLALTWRHDWADRLSSRATLENRYLDFAGIDRQDSERHAEFKLLYDIQRWLQLGAGLALENRNSNLATRDFNRTLVSASVRISL